MPVVSINEPVGNTAMIAISGRVDVLATGQLTKAVDGLLAAGHKNLVADFSQAVYISSAGLHQIFRLAKSIEKAGGRMVACGLHGEVEQIFDIVGYETQYPTAKNAEEALQQIG